MKDGRLPNDLAEYIRQKYTRFAVKCGIWLGVVFIAEVSFLYRLVASYRGHINAIALFAVLVILPFIIFGGFKLIFDKSWEGKVILVEVSSKTNAGNVNDVVVRRTAGKTYAGIRRNFGTYIACEIYVETDDGKTHTYLHALEHPEKLIYKVGDRVKKIKGLPHPVNITSPKRECAVCGEVNAAGAHECAVCGYSLIE